MASDAAMVDVRMPVTLVEAARSKAAVASRSVEAQPGHWARLGRKPERSEASVSWRAREAIEGRLDPTEDEIAAMREIAGLPRAVGTDGSGRPWAGKKTARWHRSGGERSE